MVSLRVITERSQLVENLLSYCIFNMKNSK